MPILWFQDTDEHETPRQRFHVDVWVAPEVAEQRITAAVAAGGIVVAESQAPSYTVIADQDGNKACGARPCLRPKDGQPSLPQEADHDNGQQTRSGRPADQG